MTTLHAIYFLLFGMGLIVLAEYLYKSDSAIDSSFEIRIIGLIGLLSIFASLGIAIWTMF